MKTFSTYGDYCLCGINVHRGTFIIGVAMLVLDLLNSLAALEKLIASPYETSYLTNPIREELNNPATSVLSLVIGVLSAICTATLLYGNRTLQPRYYTPHLIVELVSCVIIFISAGLVALGGLLAMITRADSYGYGRNSGVALLFLSLIFVGIGLLRYYFSYVVVKRSERLLRMQFAEYVQQAPPMHMKDMY